MPHASKNQNIKPKQYRNKFIKDLKNSPHQKNIKKKKKGIEVQRQEQQAEWTTSSSRILLGGRGWHWFVT